MKALLDFFPLLAFFLAYVFGDLYIAAGALLVASLIQLIGNYLLTRKVEKLHIIIFVATLIFVVPTIVFRNPLFLIWKVSVVTWGLAVAMLVRRLVWKRSAVRDVMQVASPEQIEMPDRAWLTIDKFWIGFYLFIGALNLVIGLNFPEQTWVYFKVWGITAINIVLMIITGIIFHKYMPDDDNSDASDAPEQADTTASEETP